MIKLPDNFSQVGLVVKVVLLPVIGGLAETIGVNLPGVAHYEIPASARPWGNTEQSTRFAAVAISAMRPHWFSGESASARYRRRMLHEKWARDFARAFLDSVHSDALGVQVPLTMLNEFFDKRAGTPDFDE